MGGGEGTKIGEVGEDVDNKGEDGGVCDVITNGRNGKGKAAGTEEARGVGKERGEVVFRGWTSKETNGGSGEVVGREGGHDGVIKRFDCDGNGEGRGGGVKTTTLVVIGEILEFRDGLV